MEEERRSADWRAWLKTALFFLALGQIVVGLILQLWIGVIAALAIALALLPAVWSLFGSLIRGGMWDRGTRPLIPLRVSTQLLILLVLFIVPLAVWRILEGRAYALPAAAVVAAFWLILFLLARKREAG